MYIHFWVTIKLNIKGGTMNRIRNTHGFTLIELMIAVAVVGIIAAIASGFIFNTKGATERRAYESAQHFISTNGIKVKRITCAGDSDSDGYGSCSILTEENEKIMLQCPSGFFDKWTGAVSCKEVFQTLQMVQ
jgi:prepilin-type N-terminal cleavage/methylation domain-containing protein